MKRQMNRLVVWILVSLALMMALSPANGQNKKPNFVMIMTDDVGWGDLGSYGGGIMRGAPTPNLDRMAAEGMRFVNYYGQASCTAGRASFVTGCIPIRTSLSSVLVPGDPNGLTSETPTIAEALKEAGYSTVQLGKWHLGDKPENFPPPMASMRCTTSSPTMLASMPTTTRLCIPTFPATTWSSCPCGPR
jgi:arylsulfatase A-like enzyme